MADIIKFVLPVKAEPPVLVTEMTPEQFVARMDRIKATAIGALEAMHITLDEELWSEENADDLAVLARELGNLFEVASTLIARRAAKKD